MKLSKLLIPFLAIVLPTVHFQEKLSEERRSGNRSNEPEHEISNDSSEKQGIILRKFSDSERFLRFAKHSSHSSHKSHSSHTSGSHYSHTSHTSGSGSYGSDTNCMGCDFNLEDEPYENLTFADNSVMPESR